MMTMTDNSILLMDARDTAYFLDTETTGSTSKDHVIDLAVVSCKDGIPLVNEQFYPTTEISRFARDIHGYTRDKLRDKPRFADRATEITETLQGKTLLAWNAAYDRRMLELTYQQAHSPLPQVRWGCLMTAHKAINRLKKPIGVSQACDQYGITRKGDHTALHDALAAARILWKMCKDHGDQRLQLEGAIPAPLIQTRRPESSEKEAFSFRLNSKDAEEQIAAGNDLTLVGYFLRDNGWEGITYRERYDGIWQEKTMWRKGRGGEVTTAQALYRQMGILTQKDGIDWSLYTVEYDALTAEEEREWMNRPKNER